MMNLRSLVTSESTTQNRSGHGIIRRGRAASSRRFFTPPSPSGLACRLVLTLAVLLAGVNAAWGQETILWDGGDAKQVLISKETLVNLFPSYKSSGVLRVYINVDKGLTIESNWSSAVLKVDKSIGSEYYDAKLKFYDIPLSVFKDEFPESLSQWGEQLKIESQENIVKVSLAIPYIDPFLNTAKLVWHPHRALVRLKRRHLRKLFIKTLQSMTGKTFKPQLLNMYVFT